MVKRPEGLLKVVIQSRQQQLKGGARKVGNSSLPMFGNFRSVVAIETTRVGGPIMSHVNFKSFHSAMVVQLNFYILQG